LAVFISNPALASEYKFQFGTPIPPGGYDLGIERLVDRAQPPDYYFHKRTDYATDKYFQIKDPRYVQITLNDPKQPEAKPGLQIEVVHFWEGFPSGGNYSFMKNQPKLAVAIMQESPTQKIPQAAINALSSASGLHTLQLIGDISHLNFTPLFNLPKLKVMTLQNPNLTSGNIKQMSQMTSLRALRIEERHSFETIPLLGKLTQLEELDLLLAGGLDEAKFLAPLKNLRKLVLRLAMTEGCAHTIPLLSSLQSLRIQPANEADISAVTKLPNLRILDVSYSHVTGESLNRLQKLEYLSVASCDISAIGFENIAKIRTLKGLDLTGTAARDSDINKLADLANLKVLVLDDTKNVTPLSVLRLSQALPSCTIDGVTTKVGGYFAKEYKLGQWDSPEFIQKAALKVFSDKCAADYVSAAAVLEDTAKQCEASGDSFNATVCYMNLADIYEQSNQIDKCVDACIDGLQTCAAKDKSPGNHPERVSLRRQYETLLRLTLSRILGSTNRIAEAKKYLAATSHIDDRLAPIPVTLDQLLYDTSRSVWNGDENASERIKTFTAFLDCMENEDVISPRLDLSEQCLAAGKTDYAWDLQSQAYAFSKVPWPETFYNRKFLDLQARIFAAQGKLVDAQECYRKIFKDANFYRGTGIYDLARYCENCAAIIDKTDKIQADKLRAKAVELRSEPDYKISGGLHQPARRAIVVEFFPSSSNRH